MSRRPSFVARWLRRGAPKDKIDRRAAPAEPVRPGARREDWLVVGRDPGDHRARALARGLAANGHETTYVARADGEPAAEEGSRVRVLPWQLARVRKEYEHHVDRLRVLLSVADAETIALARDLGQSGARVAYDAPAPTGAPAGPLSYDAQTERALVDGVEDLIGLDAKAARHLSSLAGGGRLVHMLPDAEDEEGWRGRARTLADLAARPSVTVCLVTGPDREETLEAVRAFEAARSDGAYRLAVVAQAVDPASDDLDALEEEGRIAVFRSARPGRAAAWNLGVSATRSEYVALVHASQRPDGAGWLRAALEALGAGRELGAVGLRARRPPGVVGEVASRLGSEAMRVAALDAVGLVAPRSSLRRVGEIEEGLEPGGLFALDLSFRIRDLGLSLALCPALGLRGAAPAPESDPAAERELRRRWSHRRAYLDGRV